jgi:HD superfamily phosphohydrolase
VEQRKIVHDPVHGAIKVAGLTLGLLDSAEMQRLGHIKQLGLANLVFPGANHTRLEHSLGALHIAEDLGSELGLEPTDAADLAAAAMLHDIGHGPFSHTLEGVVHAQLGFDHVEHSKRIIRGEVDALPPGDRDRLGDATPVADLLRHEGYNPDRVASLLDSARGPTLFDYEEGRRPTGEEASRGARHLRQLIAGAVDVDQIDYLMRDAHYTGVAYGVIDVDRLLQTLVVHEGELCIDRGGVSALEGMLVARGLMYTSVYFHRAARIAELMLARAVERLDDRDFLGVMVALTDMELLAEMTARGGAAAGTVMALKYRRLLKSALQLPVADATEAQRARMVELVRVDVRRAWEDELAERAGLMPGEVIVDVPAAELLLSEPRLYTTDIRVLEGGELHPLSRYSPLARALQQRTATNWGLLVAAPRGSIETVAAVARRDLP